ncbi:MAG: hypothetical protein IIZ78_29280 [Clostridiales bacterium]|nr:hypothetical protein [Clostridiales bacterium]
MRDSIKIGKRNPKEIELECNAATPLIYKRIFGKNLFDEFTKLNDLAIDDKLEVIDSLVFVANKMATLPFREVLNLKMDDYIEFLTGYDMDDLMDVNLITKITQMWSDNVNVDTEARKPSEADS